MCSVFLMIITRICGYSTICREEQHPHCAPTFNFSPSSSIASPYSVFFLVLLYFLILWRTNRVLAAAKNIRTAQTSLAYVVLPIGFLLSSSYWVLDTIEGHDFIPDWRIIVSSLKLKLGSIAFPIIIFISFALWMIDAFSTSPKKPAPLGISYYLFIKIIFMILNMLQKPMGGVMLCLSFIQLQTVLEIFCVWRDNYSAFSKTLVYSFTIYLFLLGERYFFATGHQRALSSIQYEIGFVGLETVNWILSPLFVLLNTYGPQILFALATPLLIVWKRKGRSEELEWLFNGMIILYLINATVSITFAGHFRRHLMVWRVFAPKFLFTTVECILELICVGISFLILSSVQ